VTVPDEPTALDACGCCDAPMADAAIGNRPGQPEIDYRIGVHGSFLRRMLRRLPAWQDAARPAARPLARLTTREREDPSIALLDAWAVVADVLTFYQERIATEGFLRTATERRSVLELARTIGYELNPGVTATAYLAFTVEDRPPPPGAGSPIFESIVPKGTRVQSMPGQGELPQTFETSAELVARPEWNLLRPRLTRPQPLSVESRRLYIAGASTRLVTGDRVLVTMPATGPGVTARVLEVTNVTVEAALERTRVDLTEAGKPPPAPKPPPPFKLPVLPPGRIVLQPQQLTRTFIQQEIIQRRWPEKKLRAQRRIQLPYWKVRDLNRHVYFEREFDFERDGLEEPELPPDLPPAVVSFSPAKDATAVPVDANILVTFDQPVRAGSVTESTFLLRESGAPGNVVDATRTWDEVSRTATLDPKQNLANNTSYTATIKGGAGGVADPSGLALKADLSWSFRTDKEHVEPEVVSHEPAANATGVDPTATVTATFSESVQAKTVTTKTFLLSQSGAAPILASVSYDDTTRTATLLPDTSLARGVSYKVELTNGILDLNDNRLRPSEWTFETKAADPPPAEPAVYAFREAASFFGHNAPKWKGLPKPGTTNDDPYPKDWDSPATTTKPDATDPDVSNNPGTPRTIWVDSQGNSLGGDMARLERAVPGLLRDSWAIFESPTAIKPYRVTGVAERSVVDYALSGRTTELRLTQEDGRSPNAGGEPDLKVRATKAHVVSERLVLADLPLDDPLLAGDVEIVLDRMVFDLDEGRAVLLSGERHDLPGVVAHEVLLLEEPVHEGGFTILRFRPGLQHKYLRRTVTINANVIAATHGETVREEILGGGDGLQPNQRFTLRKPPLTFVSAPTARGSESTLEVRVDEVLWDEAASLHDLGPCDRRYVLRIDQDGATSVIFGDGSHGARPSTGTENVRATYRSGIGMAGMVLAEKLTLLQTRPLGIQSVINPLEASGAEEPESRDGARRNAPLTVLTLDRIVSLRDYEDFARAFAGIGKAQAVELRRGELVLVHLTMAAANGDEISETSSVFVNLVEAIDRVRDPGATVVVESYARRFFNLEADILVDRRYRPESVLEAARSALAAAFSFELRDFGQPATAAEIITLIQAVPGVVMTDLNKLYPVQEEAPEAPPANPLTQILTVERARLAPSGTEPAQLLLVNPAGITLTEGTP
jgi:predicted phage baseplate assembly protein